MLITIADCDLTVCRELDQWLTNEQIQKFAMFDQSFTDEFNYYQQNLNSSEKAFIKVIYIDNILMSYLVLLHYVVNDLAEVAINPLVINPKYHGQGYGKIVLNFIIQNIDSIVGSPIDSIVGTISINNEPSIKLFSSLGFKQTETSVDKSFVELQLLLNKKTN